MNFKQWLEYHHEYSNVHDITEPFKKGDTVKVFHGFDNIIEAIEVARHGLSGKLRARRKYSYEVSTNPKGLFVTINKKTAQKFSGEGCVIEFIAKFISLNEEILRIWIDDEKKFGEISNKFIIPKPKKYMVYYSSKGRGFITQKYQTDWTSYDKDWIRESMNELNSAGDWSYYDGDYIESDVDEFDEDDLDIDDIEVVRESKNKSILNKLVVENTSEIIESLNRKTLLELRQLIDSKLRII